MLPSSDEPYTVTYDEEKSEYVVEGPRIEKMLGYTNLDSERGFTFFQNFLKETVFWNSWKPLESAKEIPSECTGCLLITTGRTIYGD